MTIIITMCKLFAALLLGYFLRKSKILDEDSTKKLSSVIVNGVLPFLILNSVSGIQGDTGEVVRLLISGVVFYFVCPILAAGIVKLLKIPVNLKGTYMCMMIFSNNIFMGYPVTSALFGDSAIFYTTMFHMFFNIMVFSLGVTLIRKDTKEMTEIKKPQNFKERITALRKIFNNGVLASIAALLIFFAGIQLPEIVTETCSFIGSTCMPFSMIVIGSSIAGYPLRDVFSDKKIYLATFVRLVLMPLLVYGAMHLVTDNQVFIKIATITVGMPVASIVAMVSASYEVQGKAASMAVVFSTLCSLITIPVMCMLLGA